MENDHHHHHSTSWGLVANAAAEEEEEEQRVSHGGRSSATTSEGLEGWPDGESDGLSRYGMEQMLRLAEDSEHATADYHRLSTRARQRNERGGPERAGGSEEEEVISEEWDAMNEEELDDGDDQQGIQAGLISRTDAVSHVIHWLKTTYEQDNNRSISKNRLYEDYVRFCHGNSMQTTTGPAFGKLVKSAFPSVKCCRRGPRSNTRHHYKHFFYIDKHMEQQLQAHEMHLENMPRCTFSRALPADDFEVRSGLFHTWTMPSNQSGSRSEPNVSVAPSVTFPPTSASWPSALPRGRAPSATTAPSTSSPHQRVRQRPYTSNKPHPQPPLPLPSDPYAQISPRSPLSSSYHPSPSSSLSSSSSSLMDYPHGFAPLGEAVARTGPSASCSASSPPSSPSRWGHQRRPPPPPPQASLAFSSSSSSSSSSALKDRSTPGNHRSSASPYRRLMGSGSESMATETGNLATTREDLKLSTYMARSTEIPDLHNRLLGQREPSFADFGPYAEIGGSTPSLWQPPLWPPQRPPQQDAHLPPTQPSGIGATIVTKKRKSENERSSASPAPVPSSVTGTPLARTLFSLEQEGTTRQAATVEHPHHASSFSSSSTSLGEGGGGGGGQGQGPRGGGGGRGSGGGGGTTTRGRTSKSGTAGKRTQASHVDGGLVGEPSSSPRSMDSFQTTPPPSASTLAQPHRPFPAHPQQSRSPPPAPPPPSHSSPHYTMPPPGGPPPPPRRSSSASFSTSSSGPPIWFHITCPSLTLNPDSFFPPEDPVEREDARAIAFREDLCQFAADYQRYAQDLISAISQWNWNQIKDLLLDFWEHVRVRFFHLLNYERLCQQLLSFEECMFANILQGLTSPHPSASSPSGTNSASTSGQTTTKTATSTTSTERKSAQVAVPEKQRFAVLFPEWLFTAQNRVLPDAWLDQTVLASARFRDSLMLRLELQRLEVVLESIIDRSLASYPEGNSSGIDASALPRPHATPLTYRMYEVWQQLDFDHINSDIILFVTYCGHNAVRLPSIQEDVGGLLYRRESLHVWTTWLRNMFFSATSSGSLAEGYIFAQQWERYSSCIWRELMRVCSSSPSSSSSSSSYQQQHQDNQLVLTAFRCFLDWMKAVLQRYNEDRSGSESVRAAMIVREATTTAATTGNDDQSYDEGFSERQWLSSSSSSLPSICDQYKR
ncbi:Transcription factor rfx3 [Balamuthia mandrillaris]